MTLRLNIFGFEVAKIELDFDEAFNAPHVTAMDRGAKAVSGWWVRRMTK